MDFQPFTKIARLSRDIIITEKLDGTNAQVHIVDVMHTPGEFGVSCALVPNDHSGHYKVYAGSRNRYVEPGNDNFGFAKWVQENAHELVKLGPGRHFGEWYGAGIQRGYGLDHKRFALFNVGRWFQSGIRVDNPLAIGVNGKRPVPACCDVVPILYEGEFDQQRIEHELGALAEYGSRAAPGFMKPEGIVVYHTAANVLFKKTLDGDGHKGKAA